MTLTAGMSVMDVLGDQSPIKVASIGEGAGTQTMEAMQALHSNIVPHLSAAHQLAASFAVDKTPEMSPEITFESMIKPPSA